MNIINEFFVSFILIKLYFKFKVCRKIKFPLLWKFYFSKWKFYFSADRSLVDKEGRPTLDVSKAVGSKLLGQDFNKPYFLHSRTSVSNYNTSDTNESSVSSGGFNYAMSNPALKERVQKYLQKFLDENPQITKEQIPLDFRIRS